MEKHHFIAGKIHYKWPFPIAMLVYQRVIEFGTGKIPDFVDFPSDPPKRMSQDRLLRELEVASQECEAKQGCAECGMKKPWNTIESPLF